MLGVFLLAHTQQQTAKGVRCFCSVCVSQGLVAFIEGMSFGHFLVDFVVTLATFCLSPSRCKLTLPRDPGTLYYLCLGPSQQRFGVRLSFPRPLGHAVLFVSTW